MGMCYDGFHRWEPQQSSQEVEAPSVSLSQDNLRKDLFQETDQ